MQKAKCGCMIHKGIHYTIPTSKFTTNDIKLCKKTTILKNVPISIDDIFLDRGLYQDPETAPQLRG